MVSFIAYAFGRQKAEVTCKGCFSAAGFDERGPVVVATARARRYYKEPMV